MIPGKRYTPEMLLKIVWRRKWFVVVPFLLITTATYGVTRLLPNRYRAETTILVVPQRIPEDYVQPTVSVRLEDRLSSINQQILSRTRLEQIVREFDLYRKEREFMIMEDVIEQMRSRDISVQTNTVSADRRQSGAPSFRISYTGNDARTVMRVTERLASLFIEENLRDRTALAEGTNQFLEAQLSDARSRLIEQEKRLETYRQRHAGELPSQLNTNMQAIQNIQLQIQTLTQSVSQDRDRSLMLDRLLADAVATPAPMPLAATRHQDENEQATLSAAQRLELARAELRALEGRLKRAHPDLTAARRTVAELERLADAEALQQPLSPGYQAASVVIDAQEQQRQARIRDMSAERDTLKRRILAKEAEETRLRESLATYQARIAIVPTRETELVELTRDYETLRQVYTNLLAKNENARAAANLERRQIGEQFKMLDPARMPERPVSPNRLQINLGGAFGGLAFGLALVLLLEYRNRSLRSEADVLGAFQVPVLAVVPKMFGVAERRRRWRRRGIAGLAAAVVAMAAGAAWKLGFIDRWL
jgi:polysaccharide chain length determinant protein (PEP-CTERM system associated)